MELEEFSENESVDVVGTQAVIEQSPVHRQQYRAICWVLTSALAIYTTRLLMTTSSYHYPATLSLRCFESFLLAYCFTLYLGYRSSPVGHLNGIEWDLRRMPWRYLLPSATWLPMIPASLIAAASLPLLLEGILHMPSLPVLVMLWPMIYVTEYIILSLGSYFPPGADKPLSFWLSTMVVVSSSVILYNEYRLMVPGLLFGIPGILFIGVARSFYLIGSKMAGKDISRFQTYHGFVVMAIAFGVLFASALSHFRENMSNKIQWSTTILIIINIAAITLTAFSSPSLLAYLPLPWTDGPSIHSTTRLYALEAITTFSSSFLILIAAIISRPITVISWVQISAYMIMSGCVLRDADDIVPSLVVLVSSIKGSSRTSHSWRPSKTLSIWFVTTILLVSGVTLISLESSVVKATPHGQISKLDSNYTPRSQFDIVVSAYDESPKDIKRMLDTVKTTNYLRTIQPNIILYTKDEDADLTKLKASTGADKIIRLDNLGREGGTYLHHIVTEWDNLAAKTLFIQAHAHNARELIPRINDYLVAETGMLSLGFAGITCGCGACEDRWGWQDKLETIPYLYEEIYDQSCEAGTSILLSYKGQFVASAQRIRGIKKSVYEDLLKAITGKDGWIHDPAIVGATDTPDNPDFGFTVERIWGLLMQCATDSRVATRCPSLLSGKGRWGKVEDCQCFDK